MTMPVQPNPTGIPPFVPSYHFTPNITPFTYRDGLTYLQRMERLVKYINRVVVPFVNENYQGLADAFTTEVNRMIETVNEALDAQDDEVDQKLAEAKAYVDTAIDSVINASVEIQDPLVAQMINDPTSDTRQALDALLVPIQTELTTISGIINDGRLSQAALDLAYVTQAEFDALSGEVNNNTTGLDSKADISTQHTVETGRLSIASLDAQFLDNEKRAIPIKLGGNYPVISSFFRTGMVSGSQDTRIVVLGGSDANAGQLNYTYKPEQAWVQRLSYRSCGKAPILGSTVISAVSASGMQWFNCAVTSAHSGTYYGATQKTELGYIHPHFVFHQIGNDDYLSQTSKAAYKGAVEAALVDIESKWPTALNILVHAQGRYDVANATVAFSAYRDALKELADTKPDTRVLIDANNYFSTLGFFTNDKNNLLADTSRLNGLGHGYLADIIGTFMGIPSEHDYADRQQGYNFPFKTDNTDQSFTVPGPVVTIDIDPARYPREVTFHGSVYATFGADSCHLLSYIHNQDSNSQEAAIGFWPAAIANWISCPITASIYLRPGVRYQAQVRVFPLGGSAIVIHNHKDYTNGKIMIHAI